MKVNETESQVVPPVLEAHKSREYGELETSVALGVPLSTPSLVSDNPPGKAEPSE
jgi:hypothetical protein